MTTYFSGILGDVDASLGQLLLSEIGGNSTDMVAGDTGSGTVTTVANAAIVVSESGAGLIGLDAPNFWNESGAGVDSAIVGVVTKDFGSYRYAAGCCIVVYDPVLSVRMNPAEYGYGRFTAVAQPNGFTAYEAGHGVIAAAASGTPSPVDTGTGSTFAAAGPVHFATGSGLDSGIASAAVVAAETGAGSDTPSPVVNQTAADAGSGVEVFPVTTDGLGGFLTPLSASVPGADAGTGSESAAVSLSATETALTVIVAAASLGGAPLERGTGVDAGSVRFAASLSDDGAGSILASLLANVTVIESPLVVESLSAEQSQFASDSGTSADFCRIG